LLKPSPKSIIEYKGKEMRQCPCGGLVGEWELTRNRVAYKCESCLRYEIKELDMKIKGSQATEFYVSNDGHLVIKQDSFEYGKAITFVLTPEQTKILNLEMPNIIKQQKLFWSNVYPSNEES